MTSVPIPPELGRVASLLVGALLAAAAAAALVKWRPVRLLRRNVRDAEVPATLGPALWLGVAAGGVVGAGLTRERVAVAVAVATAATITVLAVVGLVDDVVGGPERGIGGHLRSLARGRPTTGILKLLAGVAAAVVLALHLAGEAVRVVGIAVLVALCTNLWNALDVSPGRALKWAAVGLIPLIVAAWSQPSALVVAATLGAVLALLPFDLRERGMLGDAGSNPLGFLVGMGLAVVLPTPGLLAAAAAALAIQVIAETVTISRVIDRVPPLRRFDRLGRRS